ncbi:hypothetical protein HRI_000826100 [Hibiscus trionum]|uniref:Uncharacterized protein n=1 Tax=Hibiscus trionum TaxID=183268 RepID=A0A9W7LP01_HIBTR|nr:hypothetical protein HRI_000826100 [Hibiscus trionum]
MAFSDRGSLLQAPPNLYKVLAARFLSATSGLCSGRHSYVLLLLPPYLRIQRSPLDVVVTLWLRRLGPWSSVSGLPADKISEIDQPAGLSYRHDPTDLFSIGASSNATRFYLTKPRARPRREFALPNSLFDNKAETPDPTFISFE